MRKIPLLSTAIASVLLLSACDRSIDPDSAGPVSTGTVSFRLSDTVAGGISAQADSVRLVASRAGFADRSFSAPLFGQILLDSLSPGRWKLNLLVYRVDGSVSWAGTDSVDVLRGRTVDAVIRLRPAIGHVRVRGGLDTGVLCTLMVSRDTIHPEKNSRLSSLRRILGVWSDASGITIRTDYGLFFEVPTLVLDEDSTVMTLGDFFHECGGIVGPCTIVEDGTVRLQDVFVPWSDLPTGTLFLKGLDTVIPVRIPPPIVPPPVVDSTGAFQVFSWRSQGGYAGGGTGESISLTADGRLTHVVRDSSGWIDTLYAHLDDSLLRRAGQILDDPRVRSLPGVEDTIDRIPMSDQFTDLYEIFGGLGPSDNASVFLRYIDNRLSCATAVCPESKAHQDLVSLVAELRAVPVGPIAVPLRSVQIP